MPYYNRKKHQLYLCFPTLMFRKTWKSVKTDIMWFFLIIFEKLCFLETSPVLLVPYEKLPHERRAPSPPFPLFYFPLSSLTNPSIQESMGNRYVKYYSTCWKSLSREKTRPSAPRQTKLAFRNSKFHSFFVSQFPWAIRNFSFQGIIVAVYNMEINYVGPQLHGESISRQAFDWRDGLMS